jgi:protein-L-isoaspartate(D-aspartate) O-methyltransferase
MRAAREEMVEEQIRARGVRDERVLEAMRDVPRHLFLSPEQWAEAHEDRPLPIGQGQTISQPYIVALMLEALRLTGPERVLEIGTGSGYQTALLLRLAAEVVSVERQESLALEAEERLRGLGKERLHLVVGDGTLGCPAHAPYDGIVVTAAGPHIPQPLREQLAEGGRLVIPLGAREEQMLVLAERHGDRLTSRDLCACRFVPLVGAEGFQG